MRFLNQARDLRSDRRMTGKNGLKIRSLAGAGNSVIEIRISEAGSRPETR